ncbi:N-acetylmuramoyl-L-alanine amidase [Azospirillum sp. ST 5-10]|uniref:N-acetylmuramoyl-L-alanine amidase n=1 Tax=unclassified Azospirillum TaxID=2630922 RepID=UPI003F4A3A45
MSLPAAVPCPSPNHGPRPEGARVELLVLHYTGMPTAAAALGRLCDPASQVSAHYTVDEDGTVHVHVPEDRRAWHAGVSAWRGIGDVNSRSIGIEIVNPGHEFGYRPFPAAQMDAVEALCAAVMGRHGIAPADVVAHSDIAPDRKRDPGELFDWPRLARAGIGLWPMPSQADRAPFGAAEVADLLARIGYDPTCAQALLAFQRRYRPQALTGTPDRDTVALLRALARAMGR